MTVMQTKPAAMEAKAEPAEYQTANGATIRDKRHDRVEPWGYVVMLDTALSGWGGAPGRSYYALAVNGPTEARIVSENAMARSEMKRPRYVFKYRADGTPGIALKPGDHLSVNDRTKAGPWYEQDGFA